MTTRLIQGDCLDVLPTLPAESADAVVTDPPAGISFMGKRWDGDKGGRRQWVAWMTEVFTEVHRVLKPGAHAFVWALPRTSHWTAWALEDAGFELREIVHHLFGSGFPKSHNLKGDWSGWGTALKPAAERWLLIRKYGTMCACKCHALSAEQGSQLTRLPSNVDPNSPAPLLAESSSGAMRLPENGAPCGRADDVTTVRGTSLSTSDHTGNSSNTVPSWSGISDARSTPQSTSTISTETSRTTGSKTCACSIDESTGMCTAKPEDAPDGSRISSEDYLLVRKPLSERTVAANVLAHGTGGLNIDAARIDSPVTPGDAVQTPGSGLAGQRTYGDWAGTYNGPSDRHPLSARHHAAGRWPANVVLSHEPECREVGTRRVKGGNSTLGVMHGLPGGIYGEGLHVKESSRHYVDADGLETVTAWDCAPECAVRLLDAQSGERASGAAVRGDEPSSPSKNAYGVFGRVAGQVYADAGGASRFFYCAKASPSERGDGNDHPTVKPLALMTWLVKLVTPPGGVVLDPFAGSGSTLLAASRLGFDAIGIDSDEHAISICKRRLYEDAPMFAEVEVT